MSSPNGAMQVDNPDASPQRRSSRTHSTDTLRTRRSHRSISRDRSDRPKDRENRDRRREHRDGERRRRSTSRDRERDKDRGERHRDRDRERDRYRHRDRSHDRSHRSDRDRDRDRDRRRDRDTDYGRHRDRDDRRRKRDDDFEDEDRAKRRKSAREDSQPPPPPPADGGPEPPRPSDSPRSRVSSRRDRSPADSQRNGRPAGDPESGSPNPIETGSPARRSPGRPPRRRRASPSYVQSQDEPYDPDDPKEDDSEARSVFVSSLAAKLTARDLGYFFEDKLGEGTVMDARIVTDRISRRSKGIGYVEFRTVELVEKALALSGTLVMGCRVIIQLTEAERNRLHAGDGSLNLPPGVKAPHGAMQLYVGSLHFNLTESDIKQVFEPFGELEFVDLHRDPMTGRSKGYAFVQYKRAEDAKMALEQMEGFDLAGRPLRVNTVHEKGTARYTQQDTLDEAGGGNLNAASRQALMQKLARTQPTDASPEPVARPFISQSMQSRSVLLKNMFSPEDESEADWDKDLAEDVKGECESKYGKVEFIKVEKETQGEIYVKFDTVESAKQAVQGLNGRWFGGQQVSAVFISDAIMQAHQ